MKNKNSTYLVLTIILVILSTIGGYFLFKIYQESNTSTYTSSSIPKIELIPTDIVQPPEQDASTSSVVITPVTTIIATATATPKLIPTVIPTKSALNTKDSKTYQSEEDAFSVSYNSQRQVHQDTEPSGNRYTFINKAGNFAVHVSTGEKWSWAHPDRQFTATLLVSGQKTFRYDINAQTIVDLQSGGKNYTLQCIHNGLESLKAECDAFISSFKIL